MNQSGQEFIGFKMLIGAIIALFVLTIIMSAITYFDSLRYDISEQTIIKGLQNAIDSPNGDVLKVKNATLHMGSYSKRAFSNRTGLSSECMSLQTGRSSVYKQEIDNGPIRVERSVLVDVYFKCIPGNISVETGCAIFCEISFGKVLRSDNEY